MRADPSKRLTILSEAEKLALYGLPDFDDFQRAEYFALTDAERALVQQRKGLSEQVYCLLQIGYFKAKQAFFNFSWQEVPPEDITFVLQRYFPGTTLTPRPVRESEYYAQRHAIAHLFGFHLWSAAHRPRLLEKAIQLARRDVTATFILTELIALLNAEKIVRPGYTTLQTIIGDALSVERRRLECLIEESLDEAARTALDQLIVREDTLSELAAIKQDAKHFGYRMMVVERHKRATLESLYRLAKALLPKLAISQQNLAYYASLTHYYTIYDLRRLKLGQTYLYLLCYAWQRYQQLSDNLVDALTYHMKQIEDETKKNAEKQLSQSRANQQHETPRVGRLLLLYVDDDFGDTTSFGTVREHAFAIMPKDALLVTGQRLCEKSVSPIELRWQAVDRQAVRFKKNLRPLFLALEFSSTVADSPWLAALTWMKKVFSRQQKLTTRPLSECPEGTIPNRLRPYLLTFNEKGDATGLRGDRYEFWIYRQTRKRLDAGELYLNDSLQHRCLWQNFDRELRHGKLKHLDYDPVHKTLTWRKPKVDKGVALQVSFYTKLPARGIADIFRFVNERCRFLPALTPLQPRYAKKVADEDSLMAVILAQAMNHGNLSMAETSDIPYHILDATHQQYLRLSTLQAANDRISNTIAELSIFPHYSFDLEPLYGSVDGQKFEAADRTLKARHSRKYFGKGVVAYTLLANHVPLQSEMIGANEHESYYVFDIYYHNTSDIFPTAITGDMHSILVGEFHSCAPKSKLRPQGCLKMALEKSSG